MLQVSTWLPWQQAWIVIHSLLTVKVPLFRICILYIYLYLHLYLYLYLLIVFFLSYRYFCHCFPLWQFCRPPLKKKKENNRSFKPWSFTVRKPWNVRVSCEGTVTLNNFVVSKRIFTTYWMAEKSITLARTLNQRIFQNWQVNYYRLYYY